MTFNFKPTKDAYYENEKQAAKDYFIKYIGDLKSEFDENEVFVEVNMDAKEHENKYSFASNKTDIGILVDKVQQYRKASPL